jgi:hypothetical protein
VCVRVCCMCVCVCWVAELFPICPKKSIHETQTHEPSLGLAETRREHLAHFTGREREELSKTGVWCVDSDLVVLDSLVVLVEGVASVLVRAEGISH